MEIGDVASYWHAKQRRPCFPSEKKRHLHFPLEPKLFEKKQPIISPSLSSSSYIKGNGNSPLKIFY